MYFTNSAVSASPSCYLSLQLFTITAHSHNLSSTHPELMVWTAPNLHLQSFSGLAAETQNHGGKGILTPYSNVQMFRRICLFLSRRVKISLKVLYLFNGLTVHVKQNKCGSFLKLDDSLSPVLQWDDRRINRLWLLDYADVMFLEVGQLSDVIHFWYMSQANWVKLAFPAILSRETGEPPLVPTHQPKNTLG